MSRLGALTKGRPVGAGLFVIAVGVASCSSGLLGLQLPTGNNTATINVMVPRSGQPSFSGTIAGGTLTGSVKGATYRSDNALPFFTYEGSAGGHRFLLHIGLSPNEPGKGVFAGFQFVVTGTYGPEAVKASASLQAPKGSSAFRVPVDGHIGTQRVTGAATVNTHGRNLMIVATVSIH